jgi:hypothetical protein
VVAAAALLLRLCALAGAQPSSVELLDPPDGMLAWYRVDSFNASSLTWSSAVAAPGAAVGLSHPPRSAARRP